MARAGKARERQPCVRDRDPSSEARKAASGRGGAASRAFSEVLGRFSDALSLLAVAHISLSTKELQGTGDEEVTIGRAIEELRGVYNDLDRGRMSSRTR